jgi:hypothetical protein
MKCPRLELFCRSAAGTVMIEAAFIIPLLIFLILGMIEICRFAQFHQKLSDAAQKMVNILNQEPYLLSSEIDALPGVAADIMAPFKAGVPCSEAGSPGATCIYVSAIQQNSPPAGAAKCTLLYGAGSLRCPADVMWQVAPSGQKGAPSSQVAPRGGCTGVETPPACPTVTTLPSGKSWEDILQQKDQVIVVEVYLQYTPLLNIPQVIAFEQKYYYQMAFATPRLGQFQFIPAGSVPRR